MHSKLFVGFFTLAACQAPLHFSQPTEIDLGEESFTPALRSADLDSDGDLDLVVEDFGSEEVLDLRFFLNQGNGSMIEGQRLVFDRVFGLTIGDLNNDGAADLIRFLGAFDDSEVLINNGDGTFAPPLFFADEFSNDIGESFTREALTGESSLGDFDNDGDLDLSMLKLVEVFTLGDGLPDPETHLELSILVNNGDGAFGAQLSFGAFQEGSRTHAGDFNGDGSQDVLITTFSGDNLVTLFLNKGDGTFEEPTFTEIALPPGSISADFISNVDLLTVSADFDGDGDLDFAMNNVRADFDEEGFENNFGLVTLLENQGDGSFAPSKDLLVVEVGGGFPRQVLLAKDVTGDGVTDLITHNSDRDFLVFQKQGDQISESKIRLPRVNKLGFEPQLLLEDFTGDTLPDMMGLGFGNGRDTLLLWSAKDR